MLILVHSPKGGVGTTFLAAQLAIRLAARGHQVTAIDFTWQDALKLHFGLLPAQPLVEMRCPPGDAMAVAGVELMNGHALSRDEAFLDALRAGELRPFPGERITIADVAADDRAVRDALIEQADIHLCPLMPRPDSLAALTKVQPGTAVVDLPRTAFILNQLDDRQRLSRHTHSFLRQLLGAGLLGSVRYDEALNESVAMLEPIAKFAPTSIVISDLDRLAGTLEERLGFAIAAAAPARKAHP